MLAFRKEIKGTGNDIEVKIKQVEEKVFNKIAEWEKIVEEDSSLDSIAKSLVNMKRVSNNISSLKGKINIRIDQTLVRYKNKTKTSTAFSKLGAILSKDANGVGPSIIVEHNAFQGYALSLFNEKTQKHGINYVLENIKGDSIHMDTLTKRCKEFYGVRYKKVNIHDDFDVVYESDSEVEEFDGNL